MCLVSWRACISIDQRGFAGPVSLLIRAGFGARPGIDNRTAELRAHMGLSSRIRSLRIFAQPILSCAKSSEFLELRDMVVGHEMLVPPRVQDAQVGIVVQPHESSLDRLSSDESDFYRTLRGPVSIQLPNRSGKTSFEHCLVGIPQSI